MKKNFVISTALSLFLLVVGASAQQTTPNFSGTWELDAAKSKLGERARVESITLTVAQTSGNIKVETSTKRAPRPEGAGDGQGGGAGMGRGFGGFGGGDTVMTYSLSGQETKVQQDSPMGKIPVTLTAKLAGGKLNLSSARSFNGPNGEISITSKETWTLSPDGKTLTIEREQSSPRGTNTTELVFVRKS